MMRHIHHYFIVLAVLLYREETLHQDYSLKYNNVYE